MANGQKVVLLENASATGSAKEFQGGKAMFFAEATYGGGTVKLQVSSPNGTFIDVPNVTTTANGAIACDLPRGLYKAHVATATAVYAYLVSI